MTSIDGKRQRLQTEAKRRNTNKEGNLGPHMKGSQGSRQKKLN